MMDSCGTTRISKLHWTCIISFMTCRVYILVCVCAATAYSLEVFSLLFASIFMVLNGHQEWYAKPSNDIGDFEVWSVDSALLFTWYH